MLMNKNKNKISIDWLKNQIAKLDDEVEE